MWISCSLLLLYTMTEDGMKANPDENTQVPRVEILEEQANVIKIREMIKLLLVLKLTRIQQMKIVILMRVLLMEILMKTLVACATSQ